MADFGVILKFADGSELQEEHKATNEEGLLNELQSRTEWFKTSNGAINTYKNPALIVSIEIKDIEENNRLTEEKVRKDLEAVKKIKNRN